MDSIKEIFKFFESIGIADEFIILAFVGIVVVYIMWKQCRLFQSYHKQLMIKLSNDEKNFSDIKEQSNGLKRYIKKLDERFDHHDIKINDQFSETAVQRGMISEKLDNLEDHIKEIKKTVMFSK